MNHLGTAMKNNVVKDKIKFLFASVLTLIVSVLFLGGMSHVKAAPAINTCDVPEMFQTQNGKFKTTAYVPYGENVNFSGWVVRKGGRYESYSYSVEGFSVGGSMKGFYREDVYKALNGAYNCSSCGYNFSFSSKKLPKGYGHKINIYGTYNNGKSKELIGEITLNLVTKKKGIVKVGSANSNENRQIKGGNPGDQDGWEVRVMDLNDFDKWSGTWTVIRPTNLSKGKTLAQVMYNACNNPCIGYSQDGTNGTTEGNKKSRYGVNYFGTRTSICVNCDCSSLVRQCITETYSTDIGSITTSSIRPLDRNSNVITKKLGAEFSVYQLGGPVIKDKTELREGDILVFYGKKSTGAKDSGHAVIVTSVQ
ncbi:MAG: hypothetical protein K6F51_13260 [Acetatifactor sp.]|nr:hypothetical protein [Acetatifactor sp.]